MSDNKKYEVYEAIGNFSAKVFESDNFNEVQDYLQDRFENSEYNTGAEADEELFYSYFSIEEVKTA